MVDAHDYGNYRFELQRDARRFEPGSYNIPGVLALGASVELLLSVGLDEVWRRIDLLTTRLCDGLAARDYRVFSPRMSEERSGIVCFDPPDPAARRTPPVEQIAGDLQRRNIIVAVRGGRLRASPHFYNTEQQIDELLEALP